jgi:hyperosmotically inducible periplasmic protein
MTRRDLLIRLCAAVPLAACSRKSIAPAADDASITAHVKTALLNDPQLSGSKINVDTNAGVVTMTGTVKSKAEEAHAMDVARRVAGVRDVKSALTIPQS